MVIFIQSNNEELSINEVSVYLSKDLLEKIGELILLNLYNYKSFRIRNV